MRHASGCNAVSKNCGWKPPLCSLLNYVHNNNDSGSHCVKKGESFAGRIDYIGCCSESDKIYFYANDREGCDEDAAWMKDGSKGYSYGYCLTETQARTKAANNTKCVTSELSNLTDKEICGTSFVNTSYKPNNDGVTPVCNLGQCQVEEGIVCAYSDPDAENAVISKAFKENCQPDKINPCAPGFNQYYLASEHSLKYGCTKKQKFVLKFVADIVVAK